MQLTMSASQRCAIEIEKTRMRSYKVYTKFLHCATLLCVILLASCLSKIKQSWKEPCMIYKKRKTMTTFLQDIYEHDTQLLRDLVVNLDSSLQQRKKRLSHVRFARPTLRGWSFFTKKVVSWDIVEEITKNTAKKHAHCHLNRIVDAVSHVINLSDKDFHTLHTILL